MRKWKGFLRTVESELEEEAWKGKPKVGVIRGKRGSGGVWGKGKCDWKVEEKRVGEKDSNGEKKRTSSGGHCLEWHLFLLFFFNFFPNFHFSHAPIFIFILTRLIY